MNASKRARNENPTQRVRDERTSTLAQPTPTITLGSQPTNVQNSAFYGSFQAATQSTGGISQSDGIAWFPSKAAGHSVVRTILAPANSSVTFGCSPPFINTGRSQSYSTLPFVLAGSTMLPANGAVGQIQYGDERQASFFTGRYLSGELSIIANTNTPTGTAEVTGEITAALVGDARSNPSFNPAALATRALYGQKNCVTGLGIAQGCRITLPRIPPPFGSTQANTQSFRGTLLQVAQVTTTSPLILISPYLTSSANVGIVSLDNSKIPWAAIPSFTITVASLTSTQTSVPAVLTVLHLWAYMDATGPVGSTTLQSYPITFGYNDNSTVDVMPFPVDNKDLRSYMWVGSVLTVDTQSTSIPFSSTVGVTVWLSQEEEQFNRVPLLARIDNCPNGVNLTVTGRLFYEAIPTGQNASLTPCVPMTSEANPEEVFARIADTLSYTGSPSVNPMSFVP